MFIKKYLKWISTALVLTGILLTKDSAMILLAEFPVQTNNIFFTK